MTGLSSRRLRAAILSTTALAAMVGVSGVAQGQTTADTAKPAASVADTKTTGEEIIVLGTRRTDRTLTNSASPVDVISSQELKTVPATNMLDQLKTIVPSFYVSQNTIADASSFVRAPSLRGLPGDETLVMLNGKRFNRSALVQVYTGGDSGLSFGSQGSDLSSIPAIAVKNLQILREGATAQYGSDAIAGVLNYGLRDNNHGLELDARYGNYYDGDGKSKQVAGNVGFDLFGRGFINLSGEYDHDDGTSRGATRPIAVVFAQQNPSLASKLPNYPGPAQIWGSSPNHGFKGVINSAIEVTDTSKLYFFGNFARSKSVESFNYRSPIGAVIPDIAGIPRTIGPNGAFGSFNPVTGVTSPKLFYLTPCPASNATCPAGGFVQDANTFQFTNIYPAGFTPQFVGVTKQMFGTVGYKGKTSSGFSYDLSASKSKNTLTLSMFNSLNASYGPQSQTSFQFGQLIQKETDANLDLSQTLDVGFASPLTISAGAEYRKETYAQTAGDLQSYGIGPYAAGQTLFTQTSPGVYAPAGSTGGASPGASGYGGTSPNSAGEWSQSSYGVYGDLEADVIKGLSVGLAGRYEHYKGVGSTFVYKANALYQLSDGFSLRGTAGTGFHAPSPGQSHDEILTTNFVAGNQVQTGTYPVNNPISQYFGAKPLTPEKSRNFGIGFVAKPVRALTLTVDAYSIKVKKRIGISQNFTVTAADILLQPALAAVGDQGNVNYFTNGYDTLTRGVDVVATYRAGLARPGDLLLTLAYNYNKSKVTKFDPSAISTDQITDVAHLAPNHRAVLSGSYTSGPITVSARENYYGWWLSQVDYPGQHFGSKFTTDLDATYQVNRVVAVSLGGANIFDNYPDRIQSIGSNRLYPLTGSTADGQIYPRTGGPFGINGGFWYARLHITY